MGLLDDLKRKLEAKKEEELKKLQERKEEELKKLQDKKDDFLKKVPFLNYEQKLREEEERKARLAERKAKQEAKRKAKQEEERKAKEEAAIKNREQRKKKALRLYEQMVARYNAKQDVKCPNCGHVYEYEEFENSLADEHCIKCNHKVSVDYYERLSTNAFIRYQKIKEREAAKAEEERKAREEAERKAKQEAERKAKQEAERKAREEEERKLQEFIPKAESGDAQAACQLGMWFQHGENGITKNIEKAIYWYQKAAMFGNQAALTFLNMALEEKKSNEKNEAQENTLRALYDSNDEYLANEKNDAQAAYRCGVEFGKKASRQYDLKNLERAIELYEKSIQYLEKALLFGHPDADTLREDIKTCEKNIKYAQLIIDTEKLSLSDVIADMRENDRRQQREQAEITRRQEEKRRESMVEVKFSAIIFFNTGTKMDRTWKREISKEEYNSLLIGGPLSIENYIRSNFQEHDWTGVKNVMMQKC